ncbi:MAG TPA: hypothetical protein VJN18_02710 [Polyangiaceae bacterium]|nr:hypothetical protein [Polyangiaceae bacterium]
MTRDAPEPTLSVFVQPTPHGVWSGNNNFGFELPFGANRNNRERIISLPEWGEPSVWTVSLGLDFSDGAWPGAERGFDVVAEVAYGVGGATETVLVDWLAGTTFSLPMNAISINAFWAFPQFGEVLSRGPEDLKLRVLLARGARGLGLSPSKFAPLLDGAPYATLVDSAVATPVARIPRFGRKLLLAPLDVDDLTGLLGANNFVRFFSAPDPGGSAVATGAFPIDAALLRSGVYVPPFSKFMTLENVGGGAAGARVRLNFLLDL